MNGRFNGDFMKLNKLKIRDIIGFHSPFTPATNTFKKRFKRAKEFLKNKGFNLVSGKVTGKKDFIDQEVLKNVRRN